MNALSTDELMSMARTESGLSDFGDNSFREGLETLVRGLNARDDLLEDRLQVIEREFVRILVNRLWMVKDLNEHLDIGCQKLLPPVVILSLPRTGSTKLQRVVSLGGDFQDLPMWQYYMPSRIPGMPNHGIERRIARTQEHCDWRLSVVPDFQQGHPMTPLEPEELVYLEEMTFCSQYHQYYFSSPEYSTWIATQDTTPTRDFTLLLMQYLQWQFSLSQPKPWLLKNPASMGREDELNRIFPQGQKIICLHREPSQCVPSGCHVQEKISQLYFRVPASVKRMYGEQILRAFVHMANEHIAWRRRNPSIDVLDLSFREVNADSLGTAEKVYEFLEMRLSEAAKNRIRAWDRENPRDKYGKKSTLDLATYGLTQLMLDEAFTIYREHFKDYF